MSLVEKAYRARISALTGQEKVARTARLLAEIRGILRRRIEATYPGIDELEIRKRIAESLYRTDQRTLRLLRRIDR